VQVIVELLKFVHTVCIHQFELAFRLRIVYPAIHDEHRLVELLKLVHWA